ncbi:Hypothetical predicted protein [Mytilus galloprovincialis]|uniref:Uncharacterized protein n=1 Tax=Mytilus galloprovincialis TaxID=29158 RepID=A0A8B6H1U5_MYTGA|nr:Hypothetical predicted protein [Mytilus galloprovincialis]
MKTELATIVPHIFGHHEQCSPTWCTYVKDPTKFRFKHLPNGKALSGDKLREELDKLAQSYIERADRLLNLGSTQSNESFNNSVASFAPKNRFKYPSENRTLERVIHTAGSPVGLALDYRNDYVYWIHYLLEKKLLRCNLNGINVVAVSTPLHDPFVLRLDVTSRWIYMVDRTSGISKSRYDLTEHQTIVNFAQQQVDCMDIGMMSQLIIDENCV